MPTKCKELPSQQELRRELDYNPKTGAFKWRRSGKGRGISLDAGTFRHGYLVICLNGIQFLAHRLVWKYVHGVDPEDQIDHINGVRGDNRVENLRECTNQQNHLNTRIRSTNTTGVKGVSFHKAAQKYCAEIWFKGEKIYIGLFEDLEDAAKAITKAREKYHGEFANQGIC